MASGQHGAVLRDVHRLFDAGTAAGMSERSLLERFVRRRDEAAFAALVARHGPMVLGVCRRWLRDPHDVEDAFQAVFLVLVRKARSIRDGDLLGPWLYGVAYRVATRARTVAARRRQHERSRAEEMAVTFPTALDLNELRTVLDEEVNRLPARFRLPIVLCHLKGLTQEEAARQLRWTPGAVRGRLAKAREKLRGRLSRRGFALPAAALVTALAPEPALAVVPACLLESTVEAALRCVSGTTLAATSAVSLAEGVGRAMTLTRLKAIAWLVPALGFAAIVAGGIATLPPAGAQDTPAKQAAVTKPEVPAKAEAKAPQEAQRTIEFRVLTAKTGVPLSGANVSLYRENETRLATDAQGRCSISVGAKLAKHEGLFISVWKDGFTPTRISFSGRDFVADPHKPYSVDLAPAGPMGGLVRDEQGRPIAGVKVSLLFASSGPILKERESVHLDGSEPLTTDAEGRWSCRMLPDSITDDDMFMVRLSHPDFVSDAFEPTRPKPSIQSLRNKSSILVMIKGVIVTGTVAGPDKRPVEGAAVSLAWNDQRPYERYTTKTNAQGRFVIPQARLGDQLLTVEAAGFAPEVRPIEVRSSKVEELEREITRARELSRKFRRSRDSSKTTVKPKDAHVERFYLNSRDVQLKPGRSIQGRVVDEKGKPIVGVVVRPGAWRGVKSLDWSTKTDAGGRFRWEHAPEEAIELTVRHPSGTEIALTATPDQENVSVTLKNLLRVHGTVVDAETGKPIDSFKVIRGARWLPAPNGPQMQWVYGDASTFRGGRYDVNFEILEQMYPRAVRIEVEGYLPAESPEFKDTYGEQVFDTQLRRGAGVEGIVRHPDGSPADGVQVLLITLANQAAFTNGRLKPNDRIRQLKTSTDGRFWFAALSEPYTLVALSDRGIALGTPETLNATKGLKLEPWSRIEGTVHVGNQPGAGKAIVASAQRQLALQGPSLIFQYESEAVADGRFVFERVIPGEVKVGRTSPSQPRGMTLWSHLVYTEVAPGRTVAIAIGGTGRPIVGRLTLPGDVIPLLDLSRAWGILSVDQPPPYPKDFLTWGPDQKQSWWEAFRTTSAGKTYFRRDNRYGVTVSADGTFQADDIPAGTYQLNIGIQQPLTSPEGSVRSTLSGFAKRELIVPEIPGGLSVEPFDIGAVELTMTDFHKLNVGDPAPPFSIKTVEGKPLTLADFQGKFVVLDFWATWCGPCLREAPHLQAIQDRHGRDDRFALIGLSLDDEPGAPRKYAAEHHENWIQGHMGAPGDSPVAAAYGVQSIPQILLIGPDGKIIAKDLRGERIEQAVAQALERK